jgi:hypothetical protein
VSGGADEARASAREMLAKLHKNFYYDGDVVSLSAGLDAITTRYAAYSAKVGLTPTGYFLTISGVKTCYAADDNHTAISDSSC